MTSPPFKPRPVAAACHAACLHWRFVLLDHARDRLNLMRKEAEKTK